MILAPISTGELFDKITILRIKQERIGDQEKLANIAKELKVLEAAAIDGGLEGFLHDPLVAELQAINAEIWHVEEGKRDCERRQDFGPRFVELARQVYFMNDKRAGVKRAINQATGSALVEEKSYAPYGAGKGSVAPRTSSPA